MSDDPNAWAPLEPNSTSQRTNPYNQITVGIRLATEGTMKALLAGMIIDVRLVPGQRYTFVLG